MGLRTMKRRRRERKTDYKHRLNLLKSGKDRIVIRKTNRYFIIQRVKSEEGQDYVLESITSKELLKMGWGEKNAGSLKSIPAGYLTGLLFAKKIKDKGDFVLDIGMARNIKGSRVYAAAMGLCDGGLNIRISEEIFPKKERLLGEHLNEELKKTIEEVKSKI